MDNSAKVKSDNFHYKGKSYDTEPGVMSRVKESFQTIDDKAQLEAIRKARSTALRAGIG